MGNLPTPDCEEAKRFADDAVETKADFLLIDETVGRRVAVLNGVAVKGTLGILEEASNRNLVEFAQAVAKLRATTIFLPDEIVQQALKRQPGRRPIK